MTKRPFDFINTETNSRKSSYFDDIFVPNDVQDFLTYSE